MSLPALAPLVRNPAALSILVHNPKICARTVARPEEMTPVVMALVEKYSGVEHQGGALDDLFPVLHLKGVEVMDVTTVETPEAAVVRRHHQDALELFEDSPSAQHLAPQQVLQQQHPSPLHAATQSPSLQQGSFQHLSPQSQQHYSQQHVTVQHRFPQSFPQQQVASQFLPMQHMESQYLSQQHLSSQHFPQQHLASQYLPQQIISQQHLPQQHSLLQHPGGAAAHVHVRSTAERRPVTASPAAQADVRTQSAGSKIREILAEMLVERGTTMRPRWGGRLVEILVNPRGPFGISSISDALAPAVEEMKKDHPRLVASLVGNGGVWPAPADAESLELSQYSAKLWARRLVRPILLGVIDQHRKQVAELNGDSKPKWFTHDELDKELRAAKDVQGDYLINPVIAAKRLRD